MTQLLEKAFHEASHLPLQEQNVIAKRLLEEIKSKEKRSVNYSEMSDAEVLIVAEQTGSFDFLNEASEDIYTLEDGEPI
ncbi:MAG: hypothetical protein KGZ58_00855 [Ignavibacteriales bacterium]|nr:hypothetical protein [Ignavibacteriales bacterium]